MTGGLLVAVAPGCDTSIFLMQAGIVAVHGQGDIVLCGQIREILQWFYFVSFHHHHASSHLYSFLSKIFMFLPPLSF